jgi:YidC/Oxa1 family membrane protein insertase
LTERDPTSVFNLFGLLPYDVPEFLMIGAWPCMMLFFMLLQRQLNPPPQDPMQAAMVKFMPFFITYILSQFAAGLVIYWTFSNAFSVIQQYIIMRMMGVEVHLFSRSKEDREMEEAVSEGPDVHPELGVLEDEVDKALFHEKTEAEQDEQTPKKDIKPPKRKPKKKK